MKKLFGIILLSSITQLTFADKGVSSGQWICYATGEQNFGGPVGPIWQTVVGRGPSEGSAVDDAIQSCMGQGLQMCSLRGCDQVK